MKLLLVLSLLTRAELIKGYSLLFIICSDDINELMFELLDRFSLSVMITRLW